MAKFKSKERQTGNVTFSGVMVQQDVKFMRLVQEEYSGKLTSMKPGDTYNAFRAARAKLAWFVNTRPESCYDVSKLTQTR